MHFPSAKPATVLRRTAYPVAAAVLSLIVFARVARTGDDGNAIPVRLIVVNSADDAQAIEARLKAGADFAVLAREESVDPTSTEGGFLGKIDPTSLRAELRDALREVQPGQLSKIVKLPSGYAILQVLTEADAADLGKADRALHAAIRKEGTIRLAPLVGEQDEAKPFPCYSRPSSGTTRSRLCS